MANRPPVSILLIVALFFLLGGLAVANMVILWTNGYPQVDFQVVNLLIAWGLLRLHPEGRRWAMAMSWLILAGGALMLATAIFSPDSLAVRVATPYSIALSQLTGFLGAIVLLLVGFGVHATLTDPEVRQCFGVLRGMAPRRAMVWGMAVAIGIVAAMGLMARVRERRLPAHASPQAVEAAYAGPVRFLEDLARTGRTASVPLPPADEAAIRSLLSPPDIVRVAIESPFGHFHVLKHLPESDAPAGASDSASSPPAMDALSLAIVFSPSFACDSAPAPSPYPHATHSASNATANLFNACRLLMARPPSKARVLTA